MLPVVWLDEALSDLAEITVYIAERNPLAARSLNKRITQQVDVLCEHPALFQAGRVAGTREVVVHPNYVVVYRVTTTSVAILNVVHSRQQYPFHDVPGSDT